MPITSTSGMPAGAWRRTAARRNPGWRRALAVVSISAFLGGCPTPNALLMRGDESSAQVSYAGNLDKATLIAREHCAQFARVPRYVDTSENIAFFDCVPR